MRKKIVICLLAFVGVTAGIWLLTSIFNNEPRYRGKTVSTWFKQYYRYDIYVSRIQISGFPAQATIWTPTRTPAQQEAIDALRAMGTNAVPFLLKEYYSTTTDTAFRTNLHALLYRLPKAIRPDAYVPAELVRAEALRALETVSAPCDFIRPLVTNRLNNGNHDELLKTVNVLCTLKCGADDVLPFLRKMLRDTNDQEYAAARLFQFDLAGKAALPDLIELINKEETRPEAVYLACAVIGRFPVEASNAFPRLRSILINDIDPGPTGHPGNFRFDLAKTLCQMQPNQPDAIQFLRSALPDRTNLWDQNALRTIGQIGPNANAIAPDLVQVAELKHEYIAGIAITNLVLIGETNLAIATAVKKMNGLEPRPQLGMIFFILCNDPGHAQATSNLVALVRHEAWGGVAITSCAEFGRLPDEVVSAIRQIANDDNAYFQWQAKNALRAIEAANPRHELH